MGKKRLTDEEIDRQIEVATERTREEDALEPRAERAHYDAASGRVVVELRDGCLFAFPPSLAQGLENATPEQLAEVEVEGAGYGLHWESLNADLSVPGLLAGRFGSARWMSAQLGRRGGKITSAAKAAAARENGRKGGRPRRRA
jgi:hypothetical protein